MNTRRLKTYTELCKLSSFDERFHYLKSTGRIDKNSFGAFRFANQHFYHSKEWKRVRNKVIVRDDGCDLGHPDYPIGGRIHVHHMNPITYEDLEEGSDILLNPEFLICVSEVTHNAITYGNYNLLPKPFAERKPNDTCPWLL